MSKTKRPHTAANSTRPDDSFLTVSLTPKLPGERRFDMFGKPELEQLNSSLHSCTLCGAAPFVYGSHWVGSEDYRRWAIDWIGFCLCRECFLAPDPDLTKSRLLARFRSAFGEPERSAQ
jgi:hypothetical protein